MPPGANGTTMRTGLVGQAPCARSHGDANAARPRATSERRRSDMAATCAPKGAPRASVEWRAARQKRQLPGAAPLSAWTKKEERDSGFGARSQTTPIGPLLLGRVGRSGEDPPDRARRKRVGLTGSRPAARHPKNVGSASNGSRWSEQRQLLRHLPRSREHRGALREGSQRHRRRAHGAGSRNQRREAKAEVSMATPLRTRASRPARTAAGGRRVPRSRRHRRARASRSRARRPRAEEARRTRDGAAMTLRHDSAARPDGGRQQQKEASGAATWALSIAGATLTTRCRVTRVTGGAQRPCQPNGVTSVA